MANETAYITRAIQIDGVVVRESQTIDSDNAQKTSPTVAAAKTGALTTRTNDTTGTLTMDSGHGFTTADLIDLYWSGGSRTKVIVGTVAGDDIPISGGSGDNLPADETAITAMEISIHSEDQAFDGDNITVISISSPVPACAHLVASDGTTYHFSTRLVADDASPPKYVYLWDNLSGVTNPVVGDDIAKIYLSHGSTSEQVIRVIIHKN